MEKKLRTFLIVTIVIVAILVVKAILFFTAKPKITINYYTEYNKISKPKDYDPNDNADELYKKARAVFVPPSEIVIWASYKLDTDINEADKIVLREWLEKNRQCIKYIEEGNKKKFFWAEENEENEGELYPKNLGPENIFQLSWLLEKYAKVAAIDGQFEDALISLIECWKIGDHYTNPKLLLVNQICGMRIKERVAKRAFVILDCYVLDVNELKSWQEQWQKQFDGDNYFPEFRTERLSHFDSIQNNFTYHPKGKGRLAWKKAKHFTTLCGKFYNMRVYLSCFIGPNSNQVLEMVTSVCDYYQSIVEKTPWEVRNSEAEYTNNLEKRKDKQPILDVLIPDLRPIWWCYHRLKARNSALVTVIAVLRYKSDHGNYPENLEVLLKDKYLAKIPQDPFCEGPLVYNLLDDYFELYSVGQDFLDDSGKLFQGGNVLTGAPYGDEVFWPPLRKGRKNIKVLDMRTFDDIE